MTPRDHQFFAGGAYRRRKKTGTQKGGVPASHNGTDVTAMPKSQSEPKLQALCDNSTAPGRCFYSPRAAAHLVYEHSADGSRRIKKYALSLWEILLGESERTNPIDELRAVEFHDATKNDDNGDPTDYGFRALAQT